jgi:alcohol dehydrogenase
MISKAYYTHFAQAHACEEKMIAMAKALGKTDAAAGMDFVTVLSALQAACGVADLKMSDYGIDSADFAKYADNARQTMGALFEVDPTPLSRDDSIRILQNSYR